MSEYDSVPKSVLGWAMSQSDEMMKKKCEEYEATIAVLTKQRDALLEGLVSARNVAEYISDNSQVALANALEGVLRVILATLIISERLGKEGAK